jgi:hypothetical protein
MGSIGLAMEILLSKLSVYPLELPSKVLVTAVNG